MTPTPPSSSPAPLLLALSGPTSSGKTTLARHLLAVFPHASVLHCDDFYLPEAQLPTRHGLLDWDCAASLDLAKLLSALRRIKAGEDVEAVKDGVESMEVPADERQGGVTPEVVRELREYGVRGGGQRHVVIIDGFLLLGNSVKEIREQCDVKVLLRATYDDAKRRREGRSGYATLEGWWEDPPGYFDKVVWPNYVDEHGFLFVDGDVEGTVNEETTGKLGISVAPSMGEPSLERTLRWLVDMIQKRM